MHAIHERVGPRPLGCMLLLLSQWWSPCSSPSLVSTRTKLLTLTWTLAVLENFLAWVKIPKLPGCAGAGPTPSPWSTGTSQAAVGERNAKSSFPGCSEAGPLHMLDCATTSTCFLMNLQLGAASLGDSWNFLIPLKLMVNLSSSNGLPWSPIPSALLMVLKAPNYL